MATLTSGVTILTPDLVMGWESTRTARTVVHAILSRSDPDVTLRPSATRTGTLRQFYVDFPHAQVALDAQSSGSVWTLAAPEVPGLSMTFVVSGDAALRSATDDAGQFVVEVGYQEVTP